MTLFVFPEAPVLTNGYGIAVRNDYLRLQPKHEDDIVWYTNNAFHDLKRDKDNFIGRPSNFSYSRVKAILGQKPSTEIFCSQLNSLGLNHDYDNIFCGDVIAYRALRKLYPDVNISVRFHNCFSRIKNRIDVLGIPIRSNKFKLNLYLISKLENEIFRDSKCKKIFLSEEDYNYYTLIKGMDSDCEIWPISVDYSKAKIHRTSLESNNITKLVWFGGAEAHKIDSILWFRDCIFPILQIHRQDLEFHLFGKDTEKFACSNSMVFAHGFYDGLKFPYKDTSLYVNPDLMGGGVKTKLKTFYENGIPFISTPYGFEGFDQNLIDERFCIIAQPEDWISTIKTRLDNIST